MYSQYKMKLIPGILIVIYLIVCPLTEVSYAEGARIVVLISHDEATYLELEAGFRKYLGQQKVNVAFDVYTMNSDTARNDKLIREIRKKDVQVVLTLGSMASEMAIKEFADIPVIASMVLNIDRLNKTGNVTGIVLGFSDETQINWLRRFLPKARNIGVLYNPEENQERIEAVGRMIKGSGLELNAQQVHSPKDLPTALKNLSNNSDVILGITDKLVLNPQTAKHILLFSFRNRIPLAGLSDSWVKAGALYSLTWDYTDMGKQCGEMAFQILQGVNIRSIPVSSPRKVLYALNLKTAEHMKLEVPEGIIKGATTVIKD